MGKVSAGSWSKPTGQRSRRVGYVKFNLHPHKNRKVYISLALTGSNPVMGNLIYLREAGSNSTCSEIRQGTVNPRCF